ncbi:MAG: N-acetylneuraminate synthase family protein [Acidobacteria bacterium]|jgi:sialic acid synthase SpsE|nr:N-acetylneuraminate synthase family protein [Acidobacteriota bacterium]
MKASTLPLGSRLLGEGQPCLVVAHVGAAHEGSPDTALRLIEAAFQAGADAIAFQIFRAEEVLVRRHRERPEMEALELSAKQWRRVLEAARASGLAVVAEVLDRPSRDVAAEAGVDALQASDGDLDNLDLLRALAATERPLLVGVGPAPERLVWEALDTAGDRLALVLCPPATPAAVDELRLGEISARRERHRVPVGLLDATDGSSAFALLAPALAAAQGADFVEKRLTLDRSQMGREWVAAMSPEQFYRMVELLRQAERARGEGGEPAREPTPSRGRSIVAAALVGRGEVLTAEMLAFKRTDERFERGLGPREADRVIGRRAARPIQADEPIQEDMLE